MAKKPSKPKLRVAAKTAHTAKAATTAHTAQTASAAKPAASQQTRRPSRNPAMPPEVIEALARSLHETRIALERYAAHLRPLDRKRLNSVGIKRQGFIHRAYEYVVENPAFLPHYLNQEQFRAAHEYFIKLHALYDTNKQIDELLQNITALAADTDYTIALAYYVSVQEAAKRRVDGAETIYNDLESIFKHRKNADAKPTVKKLKRDESALLRGKKNGIIEVVNVKPKLTGGIHKVIDEKI